MSLSPIAIPLIMTSAGPQPTPPATLRAAVQQAVAAVQPGYTADLPGTLIEDLLSTEMGALVTADQARVDAVQSVSPYGAAPSVLAELGAMLGLQQGLPTNTSVYVVFSGPVGYVIPAGFIISDGTYQYQTQQGTVIGSNGTSAQTFAVATQSGIWTPLANTVTQIVTTLPSGYTITVTNPQAGVPGTGAESVQSYRGRTMIAMGEIGIGVVNYIKSLLLAIPGVSPRLVAVKQTQASWEIICGGGDPYAVANAIFLGTLHFPMLMGSMVADRNIQVSLVNPPDNYLITYVNPAAQTTTVAITWNTTLTNFTASSQVNQLGQIAVLNYINAVPVGSPLNLLGVQDAFQDAIASVLPRHLLTSFAVTVTVNGTVVTPAAGTNIIATMHNSDYFLAAPTGVTVAQG